MSKIIKSALIFTLIMGLVLVVPVPLSSAQDSSKITISGYIRDSNGNGLQGAHIIFNVPSVVSGVSSDHSGYYEILAPQGTYKVNVWPPFDSNYIMYEEENFTVESDLTKNITLNLGHKLSGHILDTDGNPVQYAIVSLNNYLTGEPSDTLGYYFCTVPTGTYELNVYPRYNHFSTYSEATLFVNRDLEKDIIVSNHTSTQPPVVQPSEPQPSTSAVFYDNFDDGVADEWIEHQGSWQLNNGKYCVTSGSDAISTVDGLIFSDCTIETTFRFTDSIGFRAGIIFRFIDSTHYYGFHISNEYDSVGIAKYTPQATAYGDGLVSVKGYNFQNNINYHLKIVVKGNLFRCYVNGEEILAINDNSYTYGGVGLRTRAAQACFDNFSVDDATLADVEVPEPISEELLTWWKLDEGNGGLTFDSSGYNRHGTINGANWLNYQGESALNFDGKTDYVSLPSLNLANLDSITVVAWINSDLTKVGYIYAHGDNGVFEMSNGHFSDGHITQIKIAHARFGVKLYPSGWYDAFSSYPLEPNRWHQLVGVWVKGDSVKVYVDGVLAGEVNNLPSEPLEDAGTSFPSSLGTYSQNRWNVDTFFKGQMSNAMVFNKALTVQEINALYDNGTIPTVARPNLDISSESSSSNLGYNIEIKGSLTINETKVANAPILLSYSVNGGKSWQDLTMVNTASDGTYSVSWNPSVTGTYLLRAVYEGGADYLGTTAGVNLSIAQDSENNVFSVNSNSTVSSLTFNSTSRTLSFSVTGESGTKGYADVHISKTLAQNPKGFEVYLDENNIDYIVSTTDDSWLLHLAYQHSTHSIAIDLGAAPQVAEETTGNWTYVVTIIASVAILIMVAFTVKRNKNIK